mgnify:CR=1 FL=1
MGKRQTGSLSPLGSTDRMSQSYPLLFVGNTAFPKFARVLSTPLDAKAAFVLVLHTQHLSAGLRRPESKEAYRTTDILSVVHNTRPMVATLDRLSQHSTDRMSVVQQDRSRRRIPTRTTDILFLSYPLLLIGNTAFPTIYVGIV